MSSTRKSLSEIRKMLVRKGFLNQHRMINEDCSRPTIYNVPRTSSRFKRHLSEKSYRNLIKKDFNKDL